jgi:hypothetical protein
MAFVELKITKPLPDTVAVNTQYTIKGTVKIEGAIGAPPWVYAEFQQKDWYKPDVVENIVYARGIPIPITGEFSINWTPDAKGKIYEYTVIATPAPLAISGVKAIASIWTFPVLARTTPALKTTTAETAPSAITGFKVLDYT